MKEGLAIIKKKGFAIFLIVILMLGIFIQAAHILFGGLIEKIFSLGPKVIGLAVAIFLIYKFEKLREWIIVGILFMIVFTKNPLVAIIGIGVYLYSRKKKS